ncbi:fungal hydrophobin [Pholiota conissans]|uniref:Hydrophobin n=1 Tax=Pholiota conissans TaxID=109636 RepID=A0A9P5Z8S6_9AGAR|nr:fungal hydrophobin [Pholiota conissans]
MFARASSVFVLALPVLAAANVLPRNGPNDNQCNTGSLQCCSSVQSASSSLVAVLLGLLGVVAGDLTGQVGVTCSPITVVGASGTSCSEQPVCCTGNTFNGVIATGCTPVNINV